MEWEVGSGVGNEMWGVASGEWQVEWDTCGEWDLWRMGSGEWENG